MFSGNETRIASAVAEEARRRAGVGAFDMAGTGLVRQAPAIATVTALTGMTPGGQQPDDRELIAAWVERVEVQKGRLVLRLKETAEGASAEASLARAMPWDGSASSVASDAAEGACADADWGMLRASERDPAASSLDGENESPDQADTERKNDKPGRTIIIPYDPPRPPRKGVRHTPGGAIDPKTQETLLSAIVRSRRWMDDILAGRIASFDDIALRESLVERHVRFLAPLAFLSPKIVREIAIGAAGPSSTLTGVARACPYRWAEQERAAKV